MMLRSWHSTVRHHNKKAGQSFVVLAKVFDGLRSFAASFTHVARAREGLRHCLKWTPVALLFVAITACGLWVVALPLRKAELLDYDWRDAVKGSSFFALVWLRLLLPEVSGRVFFAVLTHRDEKLAISVKAMPAIYSKRARARSLAIMVVLGCAAVAAVIALGALLLPALAGVAAAALAAAGAFLAAWWLVLLIAVPLVGGALMMGVQVYSLFSPILRLWRFDPVLMLVLGICIALGSMKLAAPGTLLRHAVVFYYSCIVLTSELLNHYTKRLERTQQEEFQSRHRWSLVGFGLPIWVLVHYFPLVAVALLEVLHGAAASLLVDLLALDAASDEKRT